MPYPGQVFEDPFYDDDGNCVDEDDWSTAPIDVEDDVAEVPQTELDPFNTINS